MAAPRNRLIKLNTIQLMVLEENIQSLARLHQIFEGLDLSPDQRKCILLLTETCQEIIRDQRTTLGQKSQIK